MLLTTEVRERPRVGLVEHSHNVLTCSACGERLLDVTVTEPQIDVTFAYRADCPFCGDHSFPAEIAGGVIIGRLAEERVRYIGTDVEGDLVILRTEKAA